MIAPRIAIGGFLHETNTFAPSRATDSEFVSGSGQVAMATGEQVLNRLAGINLGIAGVLEHASTNDWTLQPTLWAMASPSAHVEEEAFERISEELLNRLRESLPVDGVLLDLHGAMVCTHLDDAEVLTPGEAVTRALDIARHTSLPVIIADTQDNPGAGGNSDTTGLARALIAAGAKEAALGCIVDPAAAPAAHSAGVGATLQLALGGRSAIPGDAPLVADFTVMSLGDGQLRADGPYFGGTEMALGLCACPRNSCFAAG